MRLYNQNIPIVFMHVPKCGGTSVMQILSKWFGEHYLRPQGPVYKRLSGDSRLIGGHPSCIHDHFNVYQGKLDIIYPEARQIFTIIREPFEMLLSIYSYGIQRKGKTLAKECGTLDRFLDVMLERRGTASLFTWLPRRDYITSLDEYSKQFMFIGTTEELQRSINLLASIVKMPPLEVGVENRSNKETKLASNRRNEFRSFLDEEYSFWEMAGQAVSAGTPLGWGAGVKE
jgi:hypothetical protein